jgi:hypothetical protein
MFIIKIIQIIPLSVVVTIVVVGGRGVVVEGSEQETLHTNDLEYF